MGRVNKYKKFDNSDIVATDKHDDTFKKVCKSRIFVCFFFGGCCCLQFNSVMIGKYSLDMEYVTGAQISYYYDYIKNKKHLIDTKIYLKRPLFPLSQPLNLSHYDKVDKRKKIHII